MYMSMHIQCACVSDVCRTMNVCIACFMCICERCMCSKEYVETLHVWHICISKNFVYSEICFPFHSNIIDIIEISTY